MERIFRHDWSCVGVVDDVAEPGGFLATEAAGLPVKLVMGADDNFKITTAEDLRRAERLSAGVDVRPPESPLLALGQPGAALR